jgi:hypothetical protein
LDLELSLSTPLNSHFSVIAYLSHEDLHLHLFSLYQQMDSKIQQEYWELAKLDTPSLRLDAYTDFQTKLIEAGFIPLVYQDQRIVRKDDIRGVHPYPFFNILNYRQIQRFQVD